MAMVVVAVELSHNNGCIGVGLGNFEDFCGWDVRRGSESTVVGISRLLLPIHLCGRSRTPNRDIIAGNGGCVVISGGISR